jgi:hypothetical protein
VRDHWVDCVMPRKRTIQQLGLLLLPILLRCCAVLPPKEVRNLQQELCNNAVVTTSSSSNTLPATSAYGVLFTVSANENENVEIASIGFYVDINELGSQDVTYEVWTMQGFYADPRRTNGGLPMDATFDYRGKFENWSRVAVGRLNVFSVQQRNYFQVPFNNIQSTIIPGGEVQSFYVTLKEVGALMQAPLENWEELGDELITLHCWDNGDGSSCQDHSGSKKQPIIHVGESVAAYPFYTVPYFYHAKKFMGSIYYLDECKRYTSPPTPAPTRAPSGKSSAAIATTSPSKSPEPTSSPTSTAAPSPQSFLEAGNRCYWFLSTDAQYEIFNNETSSTYGMLFSLESHEEDYDGVYISSIGIHVDFDSIPADNEGKVVGYEIYSLVIDGHYADTNRTSQLKFDYRGDFSFWEKISQGTITHDGDDDYYQIPFDNFRPTYVPPNGGIRSFYVTLDEPALVYKELDRRQNVGKKQKDDDYNNNQKRRDTPTLLIGEIVIGYPFIDAEFLYSAKQFVGKVIQEYDCPSASPSSQPSHVPSWEPSSRPSVSMSPTDSPTFAPTDKPSSIPSISTSPSTSPMPTAKALQNDSSSNFSSFLQVSLLGSVIYVVCVALVIT